MSESLSDQVRLLLDPDNEQPDKSIRDLVMGSSDLGPGVSYTDGLRLLLDPSNDTPELSLMDLVILSEEPLNLYLLKLL